MANMVRRATGTSAGGGGGGETSAVMDSFVERGLGVNFAVFLKNRFDSLRKCVGSGTEHVHLLRQYPAEVKAVSEMWAALLSCGHPALLRQVALSGVIETIVKDMLGCTAFVKIDSVAVPFSFSPFNYTWPARVQAIKLTKV